MIGLGSDKNWKPFPIPSNSFYQMKTSALVVVSSSVMGEKCEKSALVTRFTWEEGERIGGVKILGPVTHYWDYHERNRDHSRTNNRRTSTCRSCHLFEVNAAASISIIKSKSPGQLFVVGSLPANTNCQQPFPDKVILSVSEETIQRPETDFAVLVGVQRIENKLLHLFGLPASQVALQKYDESLLLDFSK